MPEPPLYDAIIIRIFKNHTGEKKTEFEFDRDELVSVAAKLGLRNPKNLGDLIYTFRYRKGLPEGIRTTAKKGLEWIIEPAGRAKYRFRQAAVSRLVPNADLVVIKIPDATPEIIAANALNDEQALLAKLRYNRLIDIFLGIAGYALQSHLRTSVAGMGQIEIDEVYVGVNRTGQQFVIPVQAKGGNDQLNAIQTRQDIACCAEKFGPLKCRPVSAQFMREDTIALFELVMQDGEIKIVDEKHYRLVPADQITPEELEGYSGR
jgi:hypothetical protein